MGDGLRVLLLNWRDTGHPEGGGSETLPGDGWPAACPRPATTSRSAAPATRARRPGRCVDGVHVVRRGGRFGVYLHAAARSSGSGGAGRRGRRAERHPVLSPAGTPAPVVSAGAPRAPRAVAGHLRAGAGRVGWWLESRLAPRVYRALPLRHGLAGRPAATSPGSASTPAGSRSSYNGTARRCPLDAAAWPRPRRRAWWCSGRLVPHKRVEHALAALAGCADAGRGCSCTSIGQGWWATELRAEAEPARGGGRRHLHRHVDERDQAPAARCALAACSRPRSRRAGAWSSSRPPRTAPRRSPSLRRRPARVDPGRRDRPAGRRTRRASWPRSGRCSPTTRGGPGWARRRAATPRASPGGAVRDFEAEIRAAAGLPARQPEHAEPQVPAEAAAEAAGCGGSPGRPVAGRESRLSAGRT